MIVKKDKIDRRNFISQTTLGVLGAIGSPALLSSCSCSNKKIKESQMPELLAKAPGGRTLKAGLIGCGGRGTGAALDFLNSGDGLEITALGDVFPDKIQTCRAKLKKEKNVEIADENCFLGFDSYEKVIDSGIDVVLLCTPPHFRPAHLEAAVNARKHIFMEKPCAVDPVGVRSVLASAKKAAAIGLCIVSGTMLRSQKRYIETRWRVANGDIGEITGAHIIQNGGMVWVRKRRPEWTDMEYMLRNWVNFCWLSGDHIVEQFIHRIDLMNWHLGEYPVKAIGWGGRQRRTTGDQYDFFSVEYSYKNGMQAHCAARQIDGCSKQLLGLINGTNGFADFNISKFFDLDGNETWSYSEDEEDTRKAPNPYVQEHIRLVNAIRTDETVNEAEDLANSTLTAIMGRVSAYTGKDVSWEEIMNSDLYLGPKTYVFGAVPGIQETPPVIGIERIGI